MKKNQSPEKFEFPALQPRVRLRIPECGAHFAWARLSMIASIISMFGPIMTPSGHWGSVRPMLGSLARNKQCFFWPGPGQHDELGFLPRRSFSEAHINEMVAIIINISIPSYIGLVCRRMQ